MTKLKLLKFFVDRLFNVDKSLKPELEKVEWEKPSASCVGKHFSFMIRILFQSILSICFRVWH